MRQEEARDKTEQENAYEYRVFGCTAGGYRVTDWGTRERAVYVHEECNWDMVSFERRVPGDDKTIQRKPNPSSDEWNLVTDDMLHLEDEEVAEG